MFGATNPNTHLVNKKCMSTNISNSFHALREAHELGLNRKVFCQLLRTYELRQQHGKPQSIGQKRAMANSRAAQVYPRKRAVTACQTCRAPQNQMYIPLPKIPGTVLEVRTDLESDHSSPLCRGIQFYRIGSLPRYRLFSCKVASTCYLRGIGHSAKGLAIIQQFTERGGIWLLK
jgi:hypothetical protein